MTTEHATLFALLADGKGWSKTAREVRAAKSATAVASERGLMEVALFGDGNQFDETVTRCADQIDAWHEAGLTFETVLDEGYPDRLDDMKQLAPFFFTKGTRFEKDEHGVAIIGSRNCSNAGLAAARRIAADLATAGVVVVSGLAAGVDTQAHLGALEAGGRTVAAIGTGINKVYPAANKALHDRIAETGLLISRFLPDSPPSKITFPLRNELLAAWCQATLVIEASATSGSRMQARLAHEQGRQLFLFESLKVEEWARDYVDQGAAQFVSNASEVLEAL